MSGVRIEVLGYVNCTYNPKHMYTINAKSQPHIECDIPAIVIYSFFVAATMPFCTFPRTRAMNREYAMLVLIARCRLRVASLGRSRVMLIAPGSPVAAMKVKV